MSNTSNRFSVPLAPCAPEAQIVDSNLRISVISDRIIRIERGEFTDKRTQMVVCRDFAKPNFRYVKMGDKPIVLTLQCGFSIDPKTLEVAVEFAGGSETVTPKNELNLGGTARTLDGTSGNLGDWRGKKEKKDHFGRGHIRKGIFAANGVTEIDDSKSVLINEDGTVCARRKGTVDKYILAFGSDYLGGLKEFYSLTGHTPVLPKYVLSNWWSRYHAYSDKEYLELMDKFESKNIPLTVATVDMDWHIVKKVPLFAEFHSIQGRGWTGYTFEKSLFPDYKAFLANLKNRGLAVTLNLHPRDGVRYFEQQYPDMAKACGIDPASKKTVKFDLTNPQFLNAYFDILHHPYEADGVDFWWVDWQQGSKSKIKGLDPLWLLNHYHFLDNCRDGKNGVILSRYAGLGSHRYPLGFSGDTVVNWKSLDFQPYFTSLASNAGYTWWSHDIGGHLAGHGDNELYLRWLQFGVFSPINRLHSNNMGRSKEPWLYPEVEELAEDYLRLRHRLLPYLYTANVRTAKDCVPLISPMYYYDGDMRSRSGEYRNQYYFGEQMLVAPVTQPGKNGVTDIRVWLPEGEWTNFFTGERFEGGKEYDLKCKLSEYPVFVKSGGIIPMLAERKGNSMDFDELEIKVYPGENEYTMFDEQGGLKLTMHGDGKHYLLSISPSVNCKTKRIKVNVVGGTINIGVGLSAQVVDMDTKPIIFTITKH